jgi:hypothetical protein
LLLAAAYGCRLLLVIVARAASPSGIFEEFLKFQKKKIKKKKVEFVGDTLSRIVIDHKKRPPPASPSK